MKGKLKKISLGLLCLFMANTLSADWMNDYFGRSTKDIGLDDVKDSVGFYIGYRSILNETNIRKNLSENYIVDGGYEVPFGMSAPLRERLVVEVGGSLGNMSVINSYNNNKKEDIFAYTIEANMQQLNYFGSVSDPIALAIGMGIGMHGTMDYKLENQPETQLGEQALFICPSIGLHYSIMELNFLYRMNSDEMGNYSLVEFKIIY